VTLLSEAVSLDSSLVEARINLSTAMVQLGRFSDASDICTDLIDAGSADSLVWYLMAVSQLNLGDRSGAEAAVDSALAVAPDFTPAVTLKALIEKTKAGGD
jgi:predicted Zn-dependent protease